MTHLEVEYAVSRVTILSAADSAIPVTISRSLAGPKLSQPSFPDNTPIIMEMASRRSPLSLATVNANAW